LLVIPRVVGAAPLLSQPPHTIFPFLSRSPPLLSLRCFFFTDTATTEIYTLSHTTLFRSAPHVVAPSCARPLRAELLPELPGLARSEEHTSELQSRENLVCRLLLEKKKRQPTRPWPLRHRAVSVHAAQPPLERDCRTPHCS